MDDKPAIGVLGIFTARPWFAPVPHSTQRRGLQWEDTNLLKEAPRLFTGILIIT